MENDFIDDIDFGGLAFFEPALNDDEIIFFNDFLATGELFGKPLFELDGGVFQINNYGFLELNIHSKPKTEDFDDMAEWLTVLIDFFLSEDAIVKQVYPNYFSFLQSHNISGEYLGFYFDQSEIFEIDINKNSIQKRDVENIEEIESIESFDFVKWSSPVDLNLEKTLKPSDAYFDLVKTKDYNILKKELDEKFITVSRKKPSVL